MYFIEKARERKRRERERERERERGTDRIILINSNFYTHFFAMHYDNQ